MSYRINPVNIRSLWSPIALLAVATLLVATAAQAQGIPLSTLNNLQTAFNGESNAHARYLAFAKKADEDGFAGAASLFRAAARAEEVHAANHAEVIRGMGAEPKADIKDPELKSTKENLQTALAGEIYERDTMYPKFIKQARADRNSAAVRTFNLAKTAEAEHAKLYKAAGENLDEQKTARTLYVCTVCGYTTVKMDFAKCPSCFTKKESYVKVS